MKDDSIVLSSRIRLARNYSDLPFPGHNAEKAGVCIERVRKALALSGQNYSFYSLYDLTDDQAGELLEEHLITGDLLKNRENGAAFVSGDHRISIMVNEDDHVRIQALTPGFALEESLAAAFEAEKNLARTNPFSFDPSLGYLTSCPTSTGTGMRASLMLHLPALTQLKKMGEIIQNVAKLGLTIRGIYGEGSEALGDLYQLSNQVTLGRTEEEIADSISAVGRQLIAIETDAVSDLLSKDYYGTMDRVSRSWGIFQHSYAMNTAEFYQLWSLLRLGASAELLPVTTKQADELLVYGQDCHLKSIAEAIETLPQTRSRMLREYLAAK